jgi:acylphosphatase
VHVIKERLTIHGRLAAPDFPDWIVHRARRLGLCGGLVRIADDAVEVLVAGPADLVDAMEVGCSLGPISVEVDRIDRAPADAGIVRDPFAYISGD